MNADIIVGTVCLLIGALGLGGLFGYQFGFIAGRQSNAADFRVLAEHITRDPGNYTGA